MSKVTFKRDARFVGNRLNICLSVISKGVTYEVHEYPQPDGDSYQPHISIPNFADYDEDTRLLIEARVDELGYKLTKQGRANRNINPFKGQKITCPAELAVRIGELVVILKDIIK